MKRADLVGKRFGRLRVLESTRNRYHHNVVWKCLCDCGTYKHFVLKVKENI